MASLSYPEWTRRLCEHFFRPERAQQPVTFFVDDDLLGQLEGSGDPDAGVDSLVTALLTRLSPDSYGRRFASLERECAVWKATTPEKCPPSLPLLATAVLAATRMARENGIAAHNYWTRFCDLIDVDKQDLRDRDAFPGLWRQLIWWLDEYHQGELGLSTIEKDPWWTIIGYALSQALFRESDRQHLTDLFRKIGLSPGEEPNPRELLQYFKAWSPASPLSPGARHMAADPRYDERLMSILADEARRWDGVLRDERGRKLASLVLTYEPTPRPHYKIAAERPLGFPENAAFSNHSERLELSAAVEGWYSEMFNLKERWLSDGLRLESGDFVLAYRPSPIVPLAQNTLLGLWASVPRVEPGEKYAVLVDDDYADDADSFLNEHARDGWKREGIAYAPTGWTLFTGVVIEESLAEIPEGPLSVLAPKLRERPTLKGGLVLDSTVALYLCGGEPDLWLPSLFDEETLVTIDGTSLPARPGQRVSLSERRLAAGSHEVAVGEAVMRFTTTREFRTGSPPGAGTFAHILARANGNYAPVSAGAAPVSRMTATDVAVAGAHLVGSPDQLPSSRPTLLLPLNGNRFRLVGSRPGALLELKKPQRPPWMDHAGDGALFPIGFETTPSFDVVWIVIERPGRITVRLRHPAPPTVLSDPSPSLEINDWCSVFDLEPELLGEAAGLWLRYAAAAAGLPKLSAPEEARLREEQKKPQHRRSKNRVSPRAEIKDRLVVENLFPLPLSSRRNDRHVYESRDKRFEVTYWPKAKQWTATEWRDEKRTHGFKLGRFKTEAEALAAVRKAVHTIRTVKRQR